MDASRVNTPSASHSTPSTSSAAGAAQRARAGGQGQGAAAASSPGDFLALLAGLSGAPEGLGSQSLLAEEGTDSETLATAADPHPAADASALAAWQGLLVPQDGALPAPGAVGRGSELANPLVAGLQATREPSLGLGTPGESPLVGRDAVASEGLTNLQGVGSEKAVLDGAADLRGGALPNSASSYGRAFTRLHNALSQRADTAEGPALRTALASAPADRAAGPLSGALAATVALQVQPSAGGLPVAAQERALDGRVLNADAVADLIGLPGSGMEQPRDTGARSSADGSGARDFGYGTGGITEPEGPIGGLTSFESALASGDAAQASIEDQISEQVTYWVNQETQNAELTVSRDGLPVEVSVSLSGNEAHVTFRSDQEQTRELLDRSMSQLSELLRGQGLVLSGMSVGSSAGRNSSERQGGDSKPQDNARQAKVSAVAPAGVPVAGVGRGSDRSVDVFV